MYNTLPILKYFELSGQTCFFRKGRNMSFIGKKEDVFFKLFADSIAKVAEASAVFMDLVTNFENAEQKVAHLKVLETECDDQTFNIIKQLNRSFVTPLDREDIFHIAKEIDDIVDYLEDAANYFLIFEVGSIRPEVITMTEIILKSITELESLFQHLSDMKKTRPIMDNVVEVNRLENEGDLVFRESLHTLFKEEKNPIELIKWKQIFEVLEASLDSCERVANMVEGVVMKYA